MHTLLQSQPVGYSDLYWIAGAAVVLIIAYFYYKKLLADRARREAINHDPRSHVVNDSNYNIANEGIDGHRDSGLDKEGAQEVVDKMKETGTIPSREEFHELREDLNEEK